MCEKINCDMCFEDKDPSEIDNYSLIFNELNICKKCTMSLDFNSLQKLYRSKEFQQDFIDSEIMIEELKNDNFVDKSDNYRNADVSYLKQKVCRLLSRAQ